MEITLGSTSDGDSGGGDGAGLQATVYHRTGTREGERAESVLRSLERLRLSTPPGEIDRREWPDTVSMDRSPWPVEVYRTASAWAERHGVSVEPPFRVASVASSRLHANDEMLRTPEVCLVIGRDGEDRAVYPHTTDAGIVEIREGLRRITATVDAEAPDRDVDDRASSAGERRDDPPTP